ncbi:MAG: hypothetical protein HOM25_08745 [Rhodospirillaceae bacterium]|jgi:hypothetical protein|nr:hypothetical protein [Rhodospirillaceae bacterium]
MTDGPVAHVLVSVWDAPYIDKFVDTALATQLSPGNIPALSAKANLIYHFYTNAESAPYLMQRTTALASHAEIVMHTFEDTVFEGETIAQHLSPYSGATFKNFLNQVSVFHLLDQIAANDPPEVLFVGDSDLLYSDGAFPIMFDALQRGKKAVVSPTVRLSLEQSQDALASALARGHGVDARTLGAMIAAFPHAAAQISYMQDGVGPAYPSQMSWPVGNGLLCRTFFPHPVAMIPNPDCRRWESTIDYDFILHCYPDPRDIEMFTDGATVTICKLSTDAYLQGQMSRAPLQLDTLADFLLSSTNEAHRPFAEQAVRYAADPDNPALDLVETESATLLADMYGYRQTLLDGLDDADPVKNLIVRSHFGPIEAYLSPQRLQRLQQSGALPGQTISP